MIARFLLFVICTAGCGATLHDKGVIAANSAREVEVTAGEELGARCTQAYRTAPPPPIAELDVKCVPARAAYGVLRAARLAMLAALTKSDDAELLQRAAELATATAAAVKAAKELP